MTTQQSQAVGPIEENASLLVLKEDDERTTTIIAHNGEDGQIIRGKGALSFRIGDFYSGNDSEQMRLTAEGNLGIGLTHPQAKLDVEGVIRASQGIMFPDGTIQTTAANSDSTGKAKRGQSQTGQDLRPGRKDRASVGTAQRQKKVSPEFTVNEDLTVNGSIFFTTGSPRDIAMLNNTGGIRIYSAPTLTSSPASAAIQFFGTGSAFSGQAYIDSGAHDNAAVIFRTAGTGGTIAERMRITATGFVGIGRSTTVNGAEVFGVQANVGAGNFGGMYLKTDSATGKPFYGYSLNGVISAYHYVDGNDSGKWKLSVKNNNDVLTATPDGNVGIGTTTPASRLHVNGTSWFQGDNTPLPSSAGAGIAVGTGGGGHGYVFSWDYGAAVPRNLLLNSPGGNVGIGTTSPVERLHVGGNAYLNNNGGTNLYLDATGVAGGRKWRWVAGTASQSYGVGDGFGLFDDSASAYRLAVDPSGNVGIGTTSPSATLDVNGDVRVGGLPFGGSITLCINNTNTISVCSSSLRYKTNIAPFSSGLWFIKQLRPITFDWKQGGMKDVGFGAEDVAKVNPLFVTYNNKGEIEGVKYDRLSAAFVNAIKEQQQQIERQQIQLKQQQGQIDGLKKLICREHRRAAVCN